MLTRPQTENRPPVSRAGQVRLSVVVPCFNEAETIAETHRRLTAALQSASARTPVAAGADGGPGAVGITQCVVKCPVPPILAGCAGRTRERCGSGGSTERSRGSTTGTASSGWSGHPGRGRTRWSACSPG